MRTAFLLAGLLVTTSPLYAQLEPLRTKIDQLLQGKHATVGVGIYDFGSQQTLTVNGEKHLPRNVLLGATTGQNRLKKLLPPGTVVAHKTGTSGVTKQGLTGAINDVGFIVLPNGKCIAISVFVSNSTESTETNERLIAAIAQVAYTYFGNAN